MNQTVKIAEQKHTLDGKKRGGADAGSLGGPLVMQLGVLPFFQAKNSIKISRGPRV